MNHTLTTIFALLVALATGSSHAQAVAGNAQAGEKKTAMCVGCHGIPGYPASFPEVYKVPRVSGQNADYIAAALDAYRKGDRKHPAMRGIAQSLSDQDIADLAAYYSAHGRATAVPQPAVPGPKVAALLQKGACFSCHGENFAKPLSPAYPLVGGQHADYLFAALKSYQRPRSPLAGRTNGVMGGVAAPFSHAELRSLADYIAALDGPLQTVPESPFRP